jgi:hypothetical protein
MSCWHIIFQGDSITLREGIRGRKEKGPYRDCLANTKLGFNVHILISLFKTS